MSPIDVALKTNEVVVYFTVEFPLPLLLSSDGRQDSLSGRQNKRRVILILLMLMLVLSLIFK
jgi:hypothetical protein